MMAEIAFTPRTRPRFKLTDEQQAANECDAPLIVVNAYAGSGKTSLLVSYASKRPSKRFLYIAFNKAIQQEAESRFGPNVVCKTTHSLAYAHVGYKYKEKLGSLRPLDLAQRFDCSYIQARQALIALTNYLTSDSLDICNDHLPDDIKTSRTAQYVLELTKKVWKESSDPASSLPISHDGYLKLYALDAPDLSKKYDVILFDEAQDANPVTTDIVMKQKKCQILMVGDRYQAIYGFRGASNAMEKFAEHKDAMTFSLTKSFRFGKGIAAAATSLLHFMLDVKKPIIGLGPVEDTKFVVDRRKPYAILSRTNGDVFKNAIDAIESGRRVALVGSFESYPFNRLLDVFNLYSGANHKIKDSFIKRFDSFFALEEYATNTKEVDLLSLIALTKEYGNKLPIYIERIRRLALTESAFHAGKADIILTTAHRSKGLEFDQVVLANDFSGLIEDGRKIDVTIQEKREEVHLLYVAMTRAKAAIELNDPIRLIQEQIDREMREKVEKALGKRAFTAF